MVEHIEWMTSRTHSEHSSHGCGPDQLVARTNSSSYSSAPLAPPPLAASSPPVGGGGWRPFGAKSTVFGRLAEAELAEAQERGEKGVDRRDEPASGRSDVGVERGENGDRGAASLRCDGLRRLDSDAGESAGSTNLRADGRGGIDGAGAAPPADEGAQADSGVAPAVVVVEAVAGVAAAPGELAEKLERSSLLMGAATGAAARGAAAAGAGTSAAGAADASVGAACGASASEAPPPTLSAAGAEASVSERCTPSVSSASTHCRASVREAAARAQVSSGAPGESRNWRVRQTWSWRGW